MILSSLTTQALVTEYTLAAQAHGAATTSGHSLDANKAYARISGVYHELRSRGAEEQKALLVLLNHSSIAVRCWAASHALDFAPEQGVPALEALLCEDGIWKLKAFTTLAQWKRGALTFE